MDQFEFELRYYTFQWLATRLKLDRDQETLLKLTKRTGKWVLEKAIFETSLDELWEATEATYSDEKKEFINQYKTELSKTPVPKPVSEYLERIEYELKVIKEMGYNTYFLIVSDYINRSKDNEIVVWPGRGSCAWSLLSYAIGITDIDPLEYDLIFERFLNPWRISMPDIDTDFEDTERDRVIQYIRRTYGNENVAHIGTYMTMAAKAAFKDVARVNGFKFEQSNKLAWMIEEKTIQKSIDKNKDLQEAIQNDSRLEKVLEIAMQLEWTVRQTWVHACGMIIAPEPTVTYTAVQYPPKSWSKWSRDETRVVSQYEGWTIEDIGLLKMDILGLRNLWIIKNTIKIIAAKSKKDWTELDPLFTEFLDTMLFHPPLDDPYPYKKVFHTWQTSGVFQFESDGMRNWLKKLRPTGFEDLIAMVSLYRPGPMDYIPHYIDRKYELEKITYAWPELVRELTRLYGEEVAKEESRKVEEDLSPFMSLTYGIAVYQEQLMRLVQAMAWFSMSEADKLRKWVGKKIREVVEKIKKEFVKKWAEHRDYKPETCTWIYEQMVEPAADYSFNKSHAACYAYISYQTAWLKAYYPVEFHAALLRSVEEETDKLAKFIDEVKLQWIKLCLPDVNKSFDHVAAINNEVVLGFRSIRWIGSDLAKQYESEREKNGKYTSLSDFFKRNKDAINKKSLEALIGSGALDQFMDRFTLWDNKSRILDRVKTIGSASAGWWGLFAMEAVDGADLQLEPVPDQWLMANLAYEFGVYKTLISSHPLDGMFPYIRRKETLSSVFVGKEGYGDFTMLGYIKSISRWMRWWFFLKVEDIAGEVEFYVTDKLDLKPFDLIRVKWYQWRSWPRLSEVQIFSYEQLLEKVKKLSGYDASMTVSQVRAERMADMNGSKWRKDTNSKTETDTVNKTEKPIEPTISVAKTASWWELSASKSQLNSEESFIDNDSKQHNSWIPAFAFPEDMQWMSQMIRILKEHQGDIEVVVGSKKKMVNAEWLEKLKALLKQL